MATKEKAVRADGTADETTAPVRFTLAGAAAGARLAVPLAVAGAAYGLVYGALARQAGMGAGEVLLTSALVSAGAAQFVTLELWSASPPVLAMTVTALVVNARHLLMGAALWPWFRHLPAAKAYPAMHFLSDESWALTQRALAAGRPDGAVLVGGGAILFAAWIGETVAGYAVGAVIGDPAAWGLGAAFAAVFAALLAGTWEGRRSVLPWVVAAGVALLAERWLPSGWYVLLGGLAGSLAGAVRGGD